MGREEEAVVLSRCWLNGGASWAAVAAARPAHKPATVCGARGVVWLAAPAQFTYLLPGALLLLHVCSRA